MNNLNPIIRVIEHIKSVQPELREEIEELKFGTIVKTKKYGASFRLINDLDDVMVYNTNTDVIDIDEKMLNYDTLDIEEIIGNLDLLILSKALGDFYIIINGEIYDTDNVGAPLERIIKLPPLHLWTEETADTIIGLIN